MTKLTSKSTTGPWVELELRITTHAHMHTHLRTLWVRMCNWAPWNAIKASCKGLYTQVKLFTDSHSHHLTGFRSKRITIDFSFGFTWAGFRASTIQCGTAITWLTWPSTSSPKTSFIMSWTSSKLSSLRIILSSSVPNALEVPVTWWQCFSPEIYPVQSFNPFKNLESEF